MFCLFLYLFRLFVRSCLFVCPVLLVCLSGVFQMEKFISIPKYGFDVRLTFNPLFVV